MTGSAGGRHDGVSRPDPDGHAARRASTNSSTPSIVGRELLDERLPGLPRVQAIVADRGYRGLAKLAARKHVKLDNLMIPVVRRLALARC